MNASKGIMIGDFDNSSGEFSNIRVVKESEGFPYGVEFSPNQKYMYTSTADGGKNNIFIWDFQALLDGATTYLRKIKIKGGSLYALQIDIFGRIWGVSFRNEEVNQYLCTV